MSSFLCEKTNDARTTESADTALDRDNHNEDDCLKIGDYHNSNSATSTILSNGKPIPGSVQIETIDTFSQRRIFSRTLANSHPLMPTKSPVDSDSEQYSALWNNFPDVVPLNEHLPPSNDTMYAKPKDIKINLIRSQSPDLLSSGSEAEVSQYFAAAQGKAKCANLAATSAAKTPSGLGKTNLLHREDILSVDSISNRSFEGEPNLASLSPSSSLIEGLDNDDEDDCEGPEYLPDNDDDLDDFGFGTIIAPPAEMLSQYSAADERRDSRSWQKITLPDGRVCEIDMRVIEPYKRVLSHGGYLNAGGQNAIVMFCACHLPDKSRTDYNYVMDNLFLYVVKTLEQLVTEDYVLIYLHGGSSRRNVPPFPWLKRCYQMLDRRLRKSLKHMYLVHPTFWMKSLVWMVRPFVSAKFWRKVVYVKTLDELDSYITVEKAAIPEKVKQYDAKHH